VNTQFSPEITIKIYNSGVIAVLVIDDAKDAIPLAHALLQGGIDIMELTLRTPAAIDALLAVKESVPEMMLGIGTVLTQDQVEEAARAGAAFAVAPGLNPKIVKKAQELSLPFSPGIVTPSDIEAACELNCSILKFFPAESSGGLEYFNSISAPYAHLGLKYIPLGGLSQDNFRQYLENPHVLAVGGSWIARREMINKNDWGTITDNAKKASQVVKEVRTVK